MRKYVLFNIILQLPYAWDSVWGKVDKHDEKSCLENNI